MLTLVKQAVAWTNTNTGNMKEYFDFYVSIEFLSNIILRKTLEAENLNNLDNICAFLTIDTKLKVVILKLMGWFEYIFWHKLFPIFLDFVIMF